MKKIFVYLFIAICLISLTGCEFEIVGLEIKDYPARIVYISGVDKELDLSGGTVIIKTADGGSGAHKMTDRFVAEITHNINFDVPGVYTVTLTRNKGKCSFPIQVIDKKYLETRINQQIKVTP